MTTATLTPAQKAWATRRARSEAEDRRTAPVRVRRLTSFYCGGCRGLFELPLLSERADGLLVCGSCA